MGFTQPITINGTVNLLSSMITLGYRGDSRVAVEGKIFNTSTSVIAYVHFTDSSRYAPGVRQVETTVIAGTITTAGNSTWTVTAAGMTGSPVAVTVPLVVGDVPSTIAPKVANALNSNVNISAWMDIAYNTTSLITTLKTPAANDGTFNIAYADDTSVGLTDDASSNNTTAGSLSTTNGFPIEQNSTSIPSGVYVLPKGTDLSTIWIHTPSSIPIMVSIAD